MEPSERYEILDTIATGEFATVYRGRDRELGREVAVKQIHQQYLDDPRQLERYWGEAQLLASLQHPNILTVHDIVRQRGWLILELMRGSLRQGPESEPIDLDFLRVALVCSLNALQFLHTNGVIHGDVKPSNMLVDARNRVKLGDFGLARRASSEEGSLLKGTTKYMAPELISNQFGSVGPPSDLYSLGFTAYELMCGSRFESLFPGLGSFGRNRQIAWMMWHSAADRKLPEINRVLEGVPEDLARVIQKLVVKDQARRYPSAADVLRDLHTEKAALDRSAEKIDAEAEAAKAAAAKRKQRLRIGAVFAVACSLMLTLAMLLPERSKPPVPAPKPPQGVIRNVYLDERKVALELSENEGVKEIAFPGQTVVTINDREGLPRDLQPGDRVTIRTYRNEQGRLITEIVASRAEVYRGRIAAVRADQGECVVDILEGDDAGKQFVVAVPEDVKIVFNGKDSRDGHAVKLADLQSDDRVVVHHVSAETGRRATRLEVERVVTLEGIVRGLDASKGAHGQLTVAQGEGPNPTLVALPFAVKCDVTINDRRILNQRELKPEDLRPGDKVTVDHDTHIVRVSAYRVLGQAGVIRQVHFSAGTLDVMLEGQSQPTTFLVDERTTISLGGEVVALDDLRGGDTVEITHDSPGARSPRALSVAASRGPDPRRWAVVVGIQDYEDRTLSPLKYPVADARLLRDRLVKRYRVPANQALLLADVSLVRLEQGTAGLLRRVRAEDKVIVYFAGHAYRDEDGQVYLAPKNFSLRRPTNSGLRLQWLVDQLEACPAKEKLLLLDCTNEGEGADRQPSTAEMLQSLRMPPGRGPLQTVTAVASCSAGQRGFVWEDKGHGLFAYCLADGFSGRADRNRDNRIEVTELFAFLKRAMASAAAEIEHAQTPTLLLPDDRPPRLSADAQKAIRKLASFLRQDKINQEAAAGQYAEAWRLAGEEPEPKLLYGLLLQKAKQRDEAFRFWEEIRIERPERLLPLQGVVWLRFEKRTYQPGVDELIELVSKVPKPPKPGVPYPKEVRRIFQWVGQLREFAATAARSDLRPSAQSLDKLDAAVAEHGKDAEQRYRHGRDMTARVTHDFDERIRLARTEASTLKLRIERHRLVHYVSFPYNEIAQSILAGLEY